MWWFLLAASAPPSAAADTLRLRGDLVTNGVISTTLLATVEHRQPGRRFAISASLGGAALCGAWYCVNETGLLAARTQVHWITGPVWGFELAPGIGTNVSIPHGRVALIPSAFVGVRHEQKALRASGRARRTRLLVRAGVGVGVESGWLNAGTGWLGTDLPGLALSLGWIRGGR